MRKLNPWQVDPKAMFRAIADSKREPKKTLLVEMRSVIESAFDHYKAHHTTLEAITPISVSSEQKDCLISCYDDKCEARDALRSSVFDAQPDDLSTKCQYCLINKPREIDHYLPKSRFPEFSVLTTNLIPCCAECNMTKHEKWLNDDGSRSVLNLYYDEIPTERYLLASVTVVNDKVEINFTLNRPNSVPLPLWNVISNHFQSLELHERYRGQVAEVVSEAISLLEVSPLISDENYLELLLREARRLRASWGENYWQAAVYEAMITSPGFVTHAKRIVATRDRHA